MLKYTGWMNSIISSQLPVPASETPLLAQLLTNRVCAGFPSPAEDLGAQRIDLTKMLITHAQATYFIRASGYQGALRCLWNGRDVSRPQAIEQATYFIRASGHSMVEAGIFDNDILVVNKALKPRHNHIVVAVVDGDFTVKQLYQRAGRVKLKAANPTHPDIVPKEGQTIEIWGVVTATIKQFVV